jgi:hypothetical protein
VNMDRLAENYKVLIMKNIKLPSSCRATRI